jgi:hypothetical protein
VVLVELGHETQVLALQPPEVYQGGEGQGYFFFSK